MNFQKQLELNKELLISSILKGKFNDSLHFIFSILSKSSFDLGTSDAKKIIDSENQAISYVKNSTSFTGKKDAFYNLSYSSQMEEIKDEIIKSISKDKFNDTFVTYYQIMNKIYYDRGFDDCLKNNLEKSNKLKSH